MESEKLYQHYTNKKPDGNGAFERMQQRLKCTKQYLMHDKCKNKLIKFGILRGDE